MRKNSILDEIEFKAFTPSVSRDQLIRDFHARATVAIKDPIVKKLVAASFSQPLKWHPLPQREFVR